MWPEKEKKERKTLDSTEQTLKEKELEDKGHHPLEPTDLYDGEHWKLDKLYAEEDKLPANNKFIQPNQGKGWEDLKKKGYSPDDARTIL